MDFHTWAKHNLIEKSGASTSESRASGPALTFKTNYRGEIIRIQVKRGSSVIEYERTNRRASDLFDSAQGEFHGFFSSTRDFGKIMSGKTLLDIGCGGGAFVSDLRNIGIDATGIDLHLSAESKKQKHFKEGDAFSLPFESESFEIITSVFSVLHYEPVDQIPALLNEMFRVLRNGGRLMISSVSSKDRLAEIRNACQSKNCAIFMNQSHDGLQILKR